MRPVSFLKQLLVLVLISSMVVLPFMDAAAAALPRALARASEGYSWSSARAGLGTVLPVPITPPPTVASPSVSNSTPARASGRRPVAPVRASAMMMQSPTLSVSVGYADNLRANPNFPVPWQGSPNILFLGAGPTFDAGAIRLDNNNSSPLTVDSVVVDLGRPGPTFNLWGSFTIPAQNSAILTQTGEFNFDTSDFPIVGCGQALSPNETRIPKVTITIGGVPSTFVDTGHILDTGGFDLVCQGNESLGWRPIGTTGIQNTSAQITLSPATSVQATGTPYTAKALVTDAGNQPIANVIVNFSVLSGPNAGKTGQATTDSTGTAAFTYTSLVVGTDILQATVTNAAGGSIQSDQVTTTWTSSNPCSPSVTPSSSTSVTTISFAGQGVGEFNDPLTLAAQLTDGNGNPLAGRSLSFTLAEQPFQATTDGNGVATVSVGAAPAPGLLSLNVTFAGETNFQASQLSTTVTIGQEETAIRYTGSTLLGTGVPQQVTAVLVDGLSGTPIANEIVTFVEGSVHAQGTTNAQGVATATLTLASSPASGQTALQVSFAGDNLYKASRTSVPVTVFLPTSFVVWGGNKGGLQLGQDVNFWGHSWTNQVTGGNFTAFTANPSFKGFADPVGQINVCEVSAGSGGPLDDHCWSSKPGNSFPPATLPPFIQVIVSTAITMSGSEIFGNIASTAVCKVDPTPVYGPDPGKPGFCKLVAVLQDGGNIFPTPPALTATQTQPAKVLPQQNFNVTAAITNNSGTPASSVILNESFDGVTPTSGSNSIGSILNGAQQTATFQVTSPTIPLRQSSESTADYETRLANTDGRVFTSTGTITFTDSVGQQFLPVTVSSSSQLQLPELTVGISGPSCVGPGSAIPYKVTVSNQGTAEARNVAILLNLPDGTNTTASIASIPVAGSVTTTINFVVPAISAKQPNETDQQYRARLAAIDGSSLVALAKVNWQDALGNNYGDIQQKIITTTERVPIITVTPQLPVAVSPGQQVTLNLSVQNIGGGNASQVLLQVTNPDGSTVSMAPFALQGGQANVVSSTFTAPVVPARQAGETDAAYQARLVSQDGKPLNFQASVNWNDVAGDSYGPTASPASTRLGVPIVTVSVTGSPVSQSGATITYTVSGVNLGHADASSAVATITLPDGSTQQVFSGVFPVGATFQQFVNFTIPKSTPASTLTATATVNWKDASQDSYGPLSSTATTSNTVPQNAPPPTGNGAALQLTPLTAGPNNTGTKQTVTATLKDNSSNPLSGVAVQFTVFGANPTSGSATTGANGNASFTYTGANPGNDQVVAMATSNGNTAISNSSQIAWIAPIPIVGGWIGSVANGAVVNTPLAISLPTVTLQSGTVSFFPSANPSAVTVLNPNASGPAGTTLATFDPTTLANGSYIIQVQGTDSNGNQQTNIVQVTVIGGNKPGRVTTTITDLRVPLGGIPITIARTYDSLKRSQTEDFGFGWALSVGVDLEVDAANNVTFTLNGQRQTFFFQPQPSSFLFPWLLIPTYSPEAGLHGTLTSDGCGGLINLQGNLTCFPTGPYQPTTFTYTDIRGTKYVVGADGTLRSIQDINGNTLTVTPGGITGKNGINVPFQRDSQGRITQITDPLGNLYQYGYDANGNLASVQYPATSNPTSYTYDPTHLLTGGTDPNLNALPTKSYDASGRLTSVTDALGNTTSYAYSTATVNGVVTNTTVITNPADANGKASTVTNTYDSLGNLLSTTDPLGHTTNNTYDANRNLTSTTDPLGRITTYTYDASGNRTSVSFPKTAASVNTTITTTYNQFSQPVSLTDQLGNVRTVTYDANFLPQIITDKVNGSPAVIESFHYNPDGTKQADALGFDLTALPNKATTYTYDANGNPASETDPLGRTTSYSYDSLGLLRSETKPLPVPPSQALTSGSTVSNITTYEYDDFGRLTQINEPLGRVTKYAYDNNGNKISETDPNGNTTTYQYDALNRLILTTFPTKPATTESGTYDFRNNLIDLTDEAGHVTHKVYDLAGRLISVTTAFGTPDASTVTYSYYDDGREKTETDPRGNTTAFAYDEAGRLTTTTDALGRQTINAYDDANRLISTKDPNQHTTTYGYDSRGRQQVVTYPDTTTAIEAYDSANNVVGLTDQAGAKVQYGYDSANQLVSVIETNLPDLAPNTTTYSYDNLGDLMAWTDKSGHQTNEVFDFLGELTTAIPPAGGAAQAITYDAAGNLLSITDFKGKTTTYTYDSVNQLLREIPDPSLSDPAVTFTYTPTGQIATMTDAGGTVTYTYDNQDRVKTKAAPAGTLTYSYDAAGNLASMRSSNPNGVSVSYTYDQLNRVSTVTDNRLPSGQGTSVYTYDPAGNLVTVAYPNGIVSTFTYDSLDRVKSLQAKTGTSAAVASFGYQLDPTGNRTAVSELNGRSVQWSYDGIYRLTSETISQDPNAKNGAVSYSLDAVGNRLSITSNLFNISSGVFSFNSNDFLSTESYDSNGNVTAEAGMVLSYDFKDRLIHATNLANNTQVLLAYDAFDNRVSKTVGNVTTQYLIDEQNPTGLPQVVEEVANGVVQKTYTYGYILLEQNQSINGNSTPSFYGYDGGGTVRFLTNAAGIVTDTYDYDAFGNLINVAGSTSNHYLYRGEQFDSDLRLYYLRARYYNPATGRFLGRDSDPGDIAAPTTLHKYSYAWNDPVNVIDPTGLEAEEEAETESISVRSAPGIAALGNRIACILNGISDALDVLNAFNGGALGQAGVSLVYLAIDLSTCKAVFKKAPAPYNRRAQYGNPSRSPAAKRIRTNGAGKPCPNCGKTMQPGTPTAPTAEHQPTLKQHYHNEGHNMTDAERRAYARSSDSMQPDAVCKTCQSSQGGTEAGKHYPFK